jgi:pentatricopeptide repeat protein
LGRLAQWLERLLHTQEVTGSSPVPPTTNLALKCSQLFTKELLDGLEITAADISTMLKRLGKATGIHCNPHSFRRGFCVHNVKSGLSNRVIQALGGWETPSMVSHYAASRSFDDALQVYHSMSSSK